MEAGPAELVHQNAHLGQSPDRHRGGLRDLPVVVGGSAAIHLFPVLRAAVQSFGKARSTRHILTMLRLMCFFHCSVE